MRYKSISYLMQMVIVVLSSGLAAIGDNGSKNATSGPAKPAHPSRVIGTIMTVPPKTVVLASGRHIGAGYAIHEQENFEVRQGAAVTVRCNQDKLHPIPWKTGAHVLSCPPPKTPSAKTAPPKPGSLDDYNAAIAANQKIILSRTHMGPDGVKESTPMGSPTLEWLVQMIALRPDGTTLSIATDENDHVVDADHYEALKAAIKPLLDTDPDSYHLIMAELDAVSAEYDGAAAELAKVLPKSQGPQIYILRGDLHLVGKHIDEEKAVEDYQAAVEAAGENDLLSKAIAEEAIGIVRLKEKVPSKGTAALDNAAEYYEQIGYVDLAKQARTLRDRLMEEYKAASSGRNTSGK